MTLCNHSAFLWVTIQSDDILEHANDLKARFINQKIINFSGKYNESY